MKNMEFELIIQKMKERGKNIDQAKQDLSDILTSITDIIPDNLDWTAQVAKTFWIAYSEWDGSNTHNGEYECTFTIKNGEAIIANQDGYEVLIRDLTYINLRGASIAIVEFIESLVHITTFKLNTEVIHNLKEVLLAKKR